jgi:predicted phosphodiesterase
VRLGLIGDVHAEDQKLRVVLDVLRAEAVDRTLCVGDLVDGPGDPNRAIALLGEAGVECVRGNHDRWLLEGSMRDLPDAHHARDLTPESIAALKALPLTRAYDAPVGKLVLCHGVGENDMQELKPDERGYGISSKKELLALLFDVNVAWMVGGHTHRSMVRPFPRGGDKAPLVVVNPGTLLTGHDPCFAVMDIARRRVDFYDISDDLRVTPGSRAVL